MVSMSRSQVTRERLELVATKHRVVDADELWAFLFAEPQVEDALNTRRRADILHVYVTRGRRKGQQQIYAGTYKKPLANSIDPQVYIVAHLDVARPTDSADRRDEAHIDHVFQEELLQKALDIAELNGVGQPRSANLGHIQALAREAMKKHKDSLSEAGDYLGVTFLDKLSGLDSLPIENEKYTLIERRSMRVLQSFYMLYGMGLRSNIRQLVSEAWGYSDNQVKVALQFLKEQGILSQRDSSNRGGADHVG
jgi:hypothetical protein